jgi:hypothetical protein
VSEYTELDRIVSWNKGVWDNACIEAAKKHVLPILMIPLVPETTEIVLFRFGASKRLFRYFLSASTEAELTLSSHL